MKKIIAISSAIILVAMLSFSVMAFRDNEPKKQKTECTENKKCEKGKADCAKSEAGSCCQKSGSSASEASAKKDDASADKQ